MSINRKRKWMYRIAKTMLTDEGGNLFITALRSANASEAERIWNEYLSLSYTWILRKHELFTKNYSGNRL